MQETTYRGRRAVQLENDQVRVSLTIEGGHLAEVLHKPTGVNPLWTPPWPTMEPSAYDPAAHPEYGTGSEAKLLAGILGQNLCLDLFGGPSPTEDAAGTTAHGEGSIAAYNYEFGENSVTLSTVLRAAQIAFSRTVTLAGNTVRIRETAENLAALDRPLAWTQHATLGIPFLEHGRTRLSLSATHSKSYEEPFGDLFPPGTEFLWPNAPAADGSTLDLRTFTDRASSAGFTTHLMDPAREHAHAAAHSPGCGVMFGYQWRRADFPWCGLWLENRSRTQAPWNGETVALGLEFGVSPMPETRRKMIERGQLFGTPAYRWLPAREQLMVEYEARIQASSTGDFAELFGR